MDFGCSLFFIEKYKKKLLFSNKNINFAKFFEYIGKMINMKLQVIVTVVVMLVSLSVNAAPFDGGFAVESAQSTLFSKDIDINKFGNNLQKHNIQVKNADYNYNQRTNVARNVSIVNGADRVSSAPTQVTLQNNTWNGYTRTGVDATVAQNVTFNRPMTIDAYSARTQVTDAFADDIIATGNMQKVSEDGFYGGGAQPGPITDVVWGFLLCAMAYIVIRRRY